METSHGQVHSAVLSMIKLQSPAFTETLSMCTMKEGKRTGSTGTERRSNIHWCRVLHNGNSYEKPGFARKLLDLTTFSRISTISWNIILLPSAGMLAMMNCWGCWSCKHLRKGKFIFYCTRSSMSCVISPLGYFLTGTVSS